MCGLFNDDTEVVTSANFMRVIYMPFDLSSLQHRGFTLVYRSFTIQRRCCILSPANLSPGARPRGPVSLIINTLQGL
ncbi:hypothetical protein ACOMHN_031129 [Nucella lapillus]